MMKRSVRLIDAHDGGLYSFCESRVGFRDQNRFGSSSFFFLLSYLSCFLFTHSSLCLYIKSHVFSSTFLFLPFSLPFILSSLLPSVHPFLPCSWLSFSTPRYADDFQQKDATIASLQQQKYDESARQQQEYGAEIERLKWELLQEQGKHAKWQQQQDEEGNVYYMNEVTGETRFVQERTQAAL